MAKKGAEAAVMHANRPKVGLFLFQSQWFKNVGLTTVQREEEGGAASLSEIIAADGRKIVDATARFADVVTTEPVATQEEASRAARMFLDKEVDLVLICPLVWSEDQPLLHVLPMLRSLPLVLWCYSPYSRPPARETLTGYLRNCGVVGALQFGGAMKKWDFPFQFLFGALQDEQTIRHIKDMCVAAATRSRLRRLTVGLLPSRSEEMTDIYVDESSLRERFGLRVKHASVSQLLTATREVGEKDVQDFVNRLKTEYTVHGADDVSILESARLSLGLREIAERMGSEALTINESDAELVATFGVRPGFYPWGFSEHQPVLTLEGDLACATAMTILNCLTGEPVIMGEIYNFDPQHNTIVVGHVGPLNPAVAPSARDVVITPDLEMSGSQNKHKGAMLEYAARPGRATMLSILATPKGFRMCAAVGESVGGPPRLPGIPHYYLRLDAGVKEFFEQAVEWGVSHHWAVVQGDVDLRLEYLARMLGVDLRVIK